MPDHSLFRLRILPWCIALAMSGSYSSVWAEDDIQFDSRFLELKGDTKIDLKRFSSQGYVEPGKYNLQVQLNKQPLAEEYDIYWYAGEDDASKSYACLTPELVAQFGLKEDVAKNLQWSHDAKCLKSGQLEGMEIKADLSQSALVISLPQAYLEYTYPDWDPPSRWDDGISGIVADYSINAQTRHEENGGDDSNEISGNGTVGVNLGPWRMRADWQTNQNMGGTRLLIDADGVADVPVEGNGAAVYTNMFGKAVVSDVNNYYRNQAYIDLNRLPENAEATQSVVQATLTEGAIGYRKFAVISGQKAMAVLRLSDGSHPPFGAEVKNDNEQTVGLVDDDGNVYLAGVKPGEHMSVFWSGVAHCDINLPDPLPADLFNGLLLPCQHKGNVAPITSPAVKPAIQEQTQRVTPTEPPTSISVNQ